MARRKPLEPTGPRRAALYIRVSSEDQAVHGTSLDSQRESLAAYAEQQGWIVKLIAEDAGISGAKGASQRPGLTEVLTAARSGLVDVVAVTAWDRMARSLKEQLDLWEIFDAAGVQYYSLKEPGQSGEQGQTHRELLAVIASDERRRIRARTAAGRAAVVAAGGWSGGQIAPYGYKVVSNGDDRGSRLVPDRAEGKVIRRLLALLVDKGLTTGEVADQLNAEGLLPRKAPRWTHTLVRQLCINNVDVWAGTWTYGKTGQFHEEVVVQLQEPVLTLKRADQLRRALEATKGRSPVLNRQIHPLSGRIICPECGRPFTGLAKTGKTRRYQCSNHTGMKTTPATRCMTPRLHGPALDAAVWEQLLPHLEDPVSMLQKAADQATEDDSLATAEALVESRRKALADVVTRGMRLGLDDATIGEMKLTAQEDYATATAEWERIKGSLAAAAANSMALTAAAKEAERMIASGSLNDPTPQVMRDVFGLCQVKVRIDSFSPLRVTATGLVMVEQVADAVAPVEHSGRGTLTEPASCRRTTSWPPTSGW